MEGHTGLESDWIEMTKAMQQLKQFSRRAAMHRRLLFTSSELEVLSRLWLEGAPMTPMSLSRSTGLQQVNTSRLIKDLRERQLVEPIPSPTDRRSYTLALTEAGRRALEESYEAYLAPVYRMRQALGRERFEQLMNCVVEANWCMESAERGEER